MLRAFCGSNSTATVAGRSPCWRATGKLCYEVEVIAGLIGTENFVAYGFAGTNFLADAIGLDETSWGINYDGFSFHKWAPVPHIIHYIQGEISNS